ncbi:hypothetical protein K8T06_01230, partial [bacterium]|nr:hypothetical protein [bacterium]
MMKHVCKMVLWVMLATTAVSAQYLSPDKVSLGLNYLLSQQNPDGSWSQTGDDYRAASVTTARTAEALLYWSCRGFGDFTPQISQANQWLSEHENGETEILAERIKLAAMAPDSSLAEEYKTALLSRLFALQDYPDDGITIPEGSNEVYNYGGFGFASAFGVDAWD